MQSTVRPIAYRMILLILVSALAFWSSPARAEIFGNVHGIIHDPQHRPVQDAAIDLKAQSSDWVQHQKSNGEGEFDCMSGPIGEFTFTVTWANLQPALLNVVVRAGAGPVLHIPLELASL